MQSEVRFSDWRFKLVLRFFWTFLTSENPHSRKHPLYLHHTPRKPSQSAETRLYLIITFNFTENSPIIARFIIWSHSSLWYPSNTPNKQVRKQDGKFYEIASSRFGSENFTLNWWSNVYMRCSHRTLLSALQCLWIDKNKEQKRRLKNVNTSIWGEKLPWSLSLWSFRCALDDQVMPWI